MCNFQFYTTISSYQIQILYILVMTKVSIQGDKASFSHIAVENLLGDNCEIVSRPNFNEVFKDLVDKRSDLVLIPIENSTYGSIVQNYDLLTQYSVYIIGEIYLKINFHVIGFDEASLADVKYLYSHKVALGQIQGFLRSHSEIQPIEYEDTAGAVNMIKTKYSNLKTRQQYAAAASEYAANFYGMKILERNIQENRYNYTRFFLLKNSNDTNKYNISTEDTETSKKVSLEFRLGEESGSLYECLEPFAKKNIPLIKIESRPIINTHWQFTYYIDLQADIKSNEFNKAFNDLKRIVSHVRILGDYANGVYIDT